MKMEGTQKTVCLSLRSLADNVESGRYGLGDDFDKDSFLDDFDEEVVPVTE